MTKATKKAQAQAQGSKKAQAEVNSGKLSLLETIAYKAEAELAFAKLTIKGRKLLSDIEEKEVKRLAKKHTSFTKTAVTDADLFRLHEIVRGNMAGLRKEITSAIAKVKPVYYSNDLQAVYAAYVDYMASGSEAAQAEAKKALQKLLSTKEARYSVKTCESLLAACGMTRGTITERASGLLVKPRSKEDFARMLYGALYQQLTAEGLRLAKVHAAEVKQALDAEAAKACAKAEKAVDGFAGGYFAGTKLD